MIQKGCIIYRSPNHPDLAAPEAGNAAQTVKTVELPKQPPIAHGLGDWVYRIAHPIGCWLDVRTARIGRRWAWAKTSLCSCLACSARRAKWNVWVPDVRRWKGGWQVACNRVAEAVQRRFRGGA